ncbi:MAG: Ig-like domain repeat protein, partial [Frankiaceae bacterium]|nr:Ig-like domain repeat protein [Frankiaceae bacterium]MBV9368701.1 Ig-like domain repeat protein [Frankiales bacterium]
TVDDPKSDGKVAGTAPNDPDLDITSLTLRTTPTDFLAYVRVDKLAAGPSTTDGHRYAVDFTFNKHVFTMSATTSAHGTNAIRDAAATSGLVGKSIQLGVDVPATTTVQTNRGLVASGLKASFDTTKSIVVFSLPISDIVKNGGAPFDGKLTAVDAKSQVESNVLSFAADTAPDANGTTWTVGDNKCFSVPTALKLAVAKKGAARTVTATLTAGGTPLAGQTISFTVNGKPAGTAVTSAKGIVTFKAAKSGQTVVATFAGAPGYDPSKATVKA